MKIIKEIIKHMDDSLREADQYVMQARVSKDDYPSVANTYLKLAEQHLDHYMVLHTAVVSMINEYKRAKGEIPKEMEIIYSYENEKLVENYEEIKRALERSKQS